MKLLLVIGDWLKQKIFERERTPVESTTIWIDE